MDGLVSLSYRFLRARFSTVASPTALPYVINPGYFYSLRLFILRLACADKDK